jgi:2,3-bisphosphoglycerate-independent phosphoglycerate mutase
MGLLSNGGVHAHINHLKAILDICRDQKFHNVFIHVFTDGRDCDPKSGASFISELQQHIHKTVGKIATISGRYYAMDRDNRWERVKLAYDAMVKGKGAFTTNPLDHILHSYEIGVTDEFLIPTVVTDDAGKPLAMINEGDAVLVFNFRTDRCREITKALSQVDLPQYEMHKMHLHFTTMTEYDSTYEKVNVIFETDNLNNTLGEVLEKNGLKQIRIAETEKYPHVTFFFSGGREKSFEGEIRIMAPSPKVATYDLQPEMSAHEVTLAILPEIRKQEASFICLNYANADMVGHTGIWQAAIKAVETVDFCVAQVVTAALENGYMVFLTADHGNADYMINEDGSPNTAHTTNPVPFFIIDKTWKGNIKPGKLGDLAPTMLHLMGINIPEEMTGNILVD